MSCDFKPGDEVEKYRENSGRGVRHSMSLPIGTRSPTIRLVGFPDLGIGHVAENWRKVQKRNPRLTIEAFSVIKDGQYEEPKRVPKKTKEKRNA